VNYRHAFHAGNFADVLKHAILLACLKHLAAKPAAFRVIDAHAGVGLYDLTSPEALRSPEWRDGIGRLWETAGLPPLLADYRAAVARANPDGALRHYPGSPELIAGALRPGDRAILCELHPADAQTVRARYAGAHGVKIEERDGWGAARAFLPPPERRGLLVLDPPFEKPDDHDQLLASLADARDRFETGSVLLWRPIKDARAEADYLQRLAATGARVLDATLRVASPQPRGLVATGVSVVNPPWTLEPALREALPLLERLLARDSGSHGRVARLCGEW
jgi:23S rRNA (adenine2030-N6)-methyltransferase